MIQQWFRFGRFASFNLTCSTNFSLSLMSIPHFFTGDFQHDYLAFPRSSQIRGYVAEVVPAGHKYCGCMLSRKVELFFPHNPESGSFPDDHTATKYWVDSYLNSNGLESTKSADSSFSYGWIHHMQLGALCKEVPQRAHPPQESLSRAATGLEEIDSGSDFE